MDVVANLYPVESQREGLTLDALLRRSVGAHVMVRLLFTTNGRALASITNQKNPRPKTFAGVFKGMSVQPPATVVTGSTKALAAKTRTYILGVFPGPDALPPVSGTVLVDAHDEWLRVPGRAGLSSTFR